MSIALLIARLALAAVFAVASLTKLADLRGSRQAMSGFGVPALLAPTVVLLLPLAELAIAAALIISAAVWVGSLAAATLLLLFIGAISVNLARGRTPDCHCFGQLHSEPIGSAVLIRNAVLLLAAAFIAVEGYHSPGLSATNWIGSLTAPEIIGGSIAIVLFALLIAQGYVLLNLLRQNGRLLLRIESIESAAPALPAAVPAPAPVLAAGLPIGNLAPSFSLPGLHGETMTLDALRAPGKEVLLLFGSPGCGPCTTLLPDIAVWQREYADRLTVALISTGTAEVNRAKLAGHSLSHVLLQEKYEIAEAYRYLGTPSAVIISHTGTIATELVAGTDAIRNLVKERFAPTLAPALPQPSLPVFQPANNQPATGSRVGSAAPAFDLPDLTGKQVRLASYAGRQILLIFWNPGCGFCGRMLPDLLAWETSKPSTAPEIVLFSTGEIETVRALGLHSTVIHDPTGAVSQAYGANGTPMAVLVDGDGRIASELAGGADAVFRLAGKMPALGNLVVVQDHVDRSDGGIGNGNGHHGIKLGDVAPPIQLPDLAGKLVSLADYEGTETLVLFWNPGCGFCRQMLPDLKAWEEASGARDPRILVVSSGAVEDIRAMELRSTVLLDPSFAAGPSYGAHGTPMAVLVDKDGKIASQVAAGAEAVLALANRLKV